MEEKIMILQKKPTKKTNLICEEDSELKKYIEDANKVHNNRYDYSKVVLEDREDNKIIIICNEHGEFLQNQYLHKSQGNGCPKCSIIRVGKKSRLSVERAIENFKKVHGEKYDYTFVEYKTAYTKIKIKCKKCETIFEQQPRHHKEGKGCPKCANYGFDVTSKAIFYYLKIIKNGVILYKIGISNNTLKERYGKVLNSFEVLKVEHFENGLFAYKMEQKILKKYKKYKYKGEKILKSGNTELFTKDVLSLDIFALPEMQINPVEIEVEVEDRTH